MLFVFIKSCNMSPENSFIHSFGHHPPEAFMIPDSVSLRGVMMGEVGVGLLPGLIGVLKLCWAHSSLSKELT